MRIPLDGAERGSVHLTKIPYRRLNARQKENFNFQKLSAVLADYGFATHRLSDDWNGADLIAQHVGGELIRIQLKSRLAFYRKYEGKDLYVAFADAGTWYLYPHDELLAKVLKHTTIGRTGSWTKRGGYSFPRISAQLQRLLSPYKVTGDAKPLLG
jgi:hypothetical protein